MYYVGSTTVHSPLHQPFCNPNPNPNPRKPAVSFDEAGNETNKSDVTLAPDSEEAAQKASITFGDAGREVQQAPAVRMGRGSLVGLPVPEDTDVEVST